MATTTLSGLRGRDFLDVRDVAPEELRGILDLARRIKSGNWVETPLTGRTLVLLFQRPSMRTRVSFHVGIERLGGRSLTLNDAEIGIGTREAVADVARVLDRYVDGIVARLFTHEDIVELADASTHPVINALTDASHPCQVLADMVTIQELLGRLDESIHVCFVGDGNNVARSLMEAASLLGFRLTVISPPDYQPHGLPGIVVTADLGALAGADVVYTDVWTSMGREEEGETRRARFAEYRVDEKLMGLAPDAIFMHCLPAHRGEEVTSGVLDGPQSVVFQQAGNRLCAQMALLAGIFSGEAL